jgi:hypothetical protein
MTVKRSPDGVPEPTGDKEKQAGNLVHERWSKLESLS